MEFKSVQKFNKSQKELATEYIKGSIRYPLRFLNILLLTGMPANKAQILIYNIKNGFRMSGNVNIRRKLLKLLDELIDICTTDSTIYARLRNMALNNKLGGLKEDVKFYLNALGINTKKELTEDMKKKVNDIIRFQEEISAQGVSGTGLGTAFSGNTTTGIASYDPVMKKMPIRRKRRL